MTDSSERYPNTNPAEVLKQFVSNRQEELGRLTESFNETLKLISDLDLVNEIIAASPRPDLALSDRVELMPVDSFDNLRRIGNFAPNMTGFGERVRRQHPLEPGREEIVGRTPPSDAELGLYFLLGARGDYDDFLEFVDEQGLERDVALEMLLQTHIGKECFIRMWILAPELTTELIRHCTWEPETKKQIDEELFVAYNIMARLVSPEDKEVMRGGAVDSRYLIH